MADFTASNGVVVARNASGLLTMTGDETDFLWESHEVALREYFAQEPKAWADAKLDEVWVLTVDLSIEVACRVDSDGDFLPIGRSSAGSFWEKDDPRITGARRIWPEGDES